MDEKKRKSRIKLLAISLIIFIIAGIISAVVKTDGNNVLVRPVNITTRGTTLSGEMYVPKSALETDADGNYTNPRPAVLMSHGYLNSNQMQDPFAMELSRRGFVVLSMDMVGHGDSEQTTGSDGPVGTTFGAVDFYNYLVSMPYVDSERVGLQGHSMGGMNTGNAVALLSGFYTLEDRLLNLLHDEFGVEITAEEVAAQDPDSIAATLSEYDQGVYEVRKAEITDEYNKRPKAELFMGSGPGFASLSDAHVVEVAGIEVWRDLQANVGVAIGQFEENPHLMFSSTVDNIIDADKIPETSMAKRLMGTVDGVAEMRTWYSLNLSDNTEQVQSTKLISFDDDDYQNAELRESIADGTARVFYQPAEEHVQNHFSLNTVSFSVNFWTTIFDYNNGELADGATPIDSSESVWLVKEIANGVMLVTFFLIIFAVVMLLVDLPFFAKIKCDVPEPTTSKKQISWWICAVLFVIIPAITYIEFFKLGGAPTTYAGNTGVFAWSWFLSEEMATRVGIWALLNGVIDFVILAIKYALVDKKRGLTFRQSLTLPKSGFVRALLLCFIVMGIAFVLVSAGSFLFVENDPRFWIMAFTAPNQTHMISWLCYLPIFFVFYFVNSLVINSSRMKDMSAGKNMALTSGVNGLSIGVFLLFNFAYLAATHHLIYLESGNDNFLAVAVIMPMVASLVIAGIFSRKLYLKTGNNWTGALLNTMIFTWIFVANTTTHYAMFM